MNRALLVYITLFMSVAFLATPRGVTFDPFPFIERQIHIEDYFYYLWEHAVILVLLHIIHTDSKEYTDFFRCVFWFQAFDLIDYLCSYNSVWFKVGVFPVSSNTIGFTFLGTFLIFKAWKDR